MPSEMSGTMRHQFSAFETTPSSLRATNVPLPKRDSSMPSSVSSRMALSTVAREESSRLLSVVREGRRSPFCIPAISSISWALIYRYRSICIPFLSRGKARKAYPLFFYYSLIGGFFNMLVCFWTDKRKNRQLWRFSRIWRAKNLGRFWAQLGMFCLGSLCYTMGVYR